jgi:hypothetical protein
MASSYKARSRSSAADNYGLIKGTNNRNQRHSAAELESIVAYVEEMDLTELEKVADVVTTI